MRCFPDLGWSRLDKSQAKDVCQSSQKPMTQRTITMSKMNSTPSPRTRKQRGPPMWAYFLFLVLVSLTPASSSDSLIPSSPRNMTFETLIPSASQIFSMFLKYGSWFKFSQDCKVPIDNPVHSDNSARLIPSCSLISLKTSPYKFRDFLVDDWEIPCFISSNVRF